MDLRKCSKIRDVVRLRQFLKKWRKQASSSSTSSNKSSNNNSSSGNNNKGMRFLKKTLSLSESSNTPPTDQVVVPKGFLAVCVGNNNETKRFVIPMRYLNHSIFVMLLRRAEEEFGFQNEGVLRIPCEVSMFENILQFMEDENDSSTSIPACHKYSSSSPNSELSYQHYSQMCR